MPVKTIQIPISLYEGFLYSVLCQFLVMQICITESEERKLIQVNHAFKRFFQTVRALDSFHGDLTTFHSLDDF
jgi:hypothetical protein